MIVTSALYTIVRVARRDRVPVLTDTVSRASRTIVFYDGYVSFLGLFGEFAYGYRTADSPRPQCSGTATAVQWDRGWVAVILQPLLQCYRVSSRGTTATIAAVSCRIKVDLKCL